MRKFHFVDFAAHYQKGFRNHIVSIADVPDLVRSFDRYGCYATYFFFSDELLTYISAHSDNGSPTIAGYHGKVWAPYFPIDLDHPSVEPALAATRLLASIFLDRWRIDPRGLQIYFSGSKGFHIMLDTRLFGRIAPAKNLPLVFDSLRRHLAQELPERLREAVDFAIKDRLRLLRLPNTAHEKSKLYKIVLGADELQNAGVDEIREWARHTRPLALTDETGLVSQVAVPKNPAAAELLVRISRQARKLARRPFAYHFRRPEDLQRLEFPCAGIEAIWQSHIEPGQRNNCAIRLASELRLLGLDAGQADDKLLEWNERNAIALPADEIHSVVRSAYQQRFPYRFSCHDAILRHFCPLADEETCRRRVASHVAPRSAGAKRSKRFSNSRP
jgi:hypothetical protein